MQSTIHLKKILVIGIFANVTLALAKAVLAFITHSSLMLSGSIHSFANSINQILLLVGIGKGKCPSSRENPFGFTGKVYYWSYVISIMLFSCGAFYANIIGIEFLKNPLHQPFPFWVFPMLTVAFIIEGYAFIKAYKCVVRIKAKEKFGKFFKTTKKIDYFLIFFEESAAMVGLFITTVSVFLQTYLGWFFTDGIASILIGIIMLLLALRVGQKMQSLLIGESADLSLINDLQLLLLREDGIQELVSLQSLQLDPNNIIVAIKVEFNHRLSSSDIRSLTDGIEKDILHQYSVIKKIFIEPSFLNS